MRKILALLRRDARTLYRDRFLTFILFYGLVLALFLRYTVRLFAVPGLPLYLAPASVLIGGVLAGNVRGYGLIDERETKTMLLTRVLPVSRTLEVLYFFISTAVLSLLLSVGGATIYGRGVTEPASFVLLVLGAALTGPLLALLLGATAENKITGLAVSKIASAAGALPALVLVVPHPWQLALAWNPWYWLYLGLLRAYGPMTELEGLAIHWPRVPGWTYEVMPLLLVFFGSWVLDRRFRRSVI